MRPSENSGECLGREVHAKAIVGSLVAIRSLSPSQIDFSRKMDNSILPKSKRRVLLPAVKSELDKQLSTLPVPLPRKD